MKPRTAAALSLSLMFTLGADAAWSAVDQVATRVADTLVTPVVTTTKHTRKTVTRKTVRRTVHHRNAASAQATKGTGATTNK